MKKVLFLQLPIPRFADKFKRSLSVNTHLAAGYLKAAAYQRGLLKFFFIEPLDKFKVNTGGDAFIINNILKSKPDILGITLSSWNTNRSLYITQKLKENLPNLKIIAGGAEVPLDFLPSKLSNSRIDIFVRGYGEDTFCKLLVYFMKKISSLKDIPGIFFKENGKILSTPSLREYSSPANFPSPYIMEYIKFSPYFNWLASSRGCSNGCIYCCWGGHISKEIIFLTEDRICKELTLARENKAKEIVFIDANLNANYEWLKKILKIIKDINYDNTIEFQGLIRAEHITEEIAKKFKECNFVAFDIGLQSLNKIALKNVKRKTNIKTWLRGIELLKKNRIKIGIDCIIMGLPGENMESIKEAINFLIENDLLMDSSFVPLSVFPASPLWKKVEKYKLTIQKSPPYLVLNTPTLSFEDIKEIINYIKKTGKPDRVILEPFRPNKFPWFFINLNKTTLKENDIKNFKRPINRILLDFKGLKNDKYYLKLAHILKERIARTVTVWVKNHEWRKHLYLIKNFLNILSKDNPYLVWHIAFEVSKAYPLTYLSQMKNSIYFHPNYLDYQGIYLAEDYRQEYFRQSTLLYNLLKISGTDYPSKWLEKAFKNFNSLWYLQINSQNINQISSQITNLLKTPVVGLLVDFSKSCNPEHIKALLNKIYACNTQNKEIFFTDFSWQTFWNKRFYPSEADEIPEENIIFLK